MITKEIALTLYVGQTLYHKTLTNADGSALRARVNGKVKTWKRQPDRFCIPMKRGMYEGFYIETETWNAGCSPDQWELESSIDRKREEERIAREKAKARKRYNLADDTPDAILHDRMIDDGIHNGLLAITRG